MAKLGTYKAFVIFVLLYVLIILVMPPNKITLATYHLSSAAYRVLLFAVSAIPAFMTWLAAFYGYDQLKRYTKLIRETPEGEAFGNLTRGAKWLALYLPLTSLVAISLASISNLQPGFRNFALIVGRYLSIIIALLAYTALSFGARQLVERVNTRPSLVKTKLLTGGFIVMGVFYCYFVIRHAMSHTGSYQLPLGWLLATVVVPYFYAWIIGLLAVLDIDAFAGKVTGVLYRKALQLMSAGLLVVIGSSILIQYVNSATLQPTHLVLGGLLIVKYILYATLASGFAIIAQSAKKLQQIEKI